MISRKKAIVLRIAQVERKIGGYQAELQRLQTELLETPPEILNFENSESVSRQIRNRRRAERRKEKNK